MANFHVLMSNSLTEDRAGPSFAKQQQQQQEVEQALQAPAQVGLNNNNGYCLPDANSSVNSLSAVHSKATPMKIGWKFGCLGALSAIAAMDALACRSSLSAAHICSRFPSGLWIL
ncbi:GL21417 [Drosophila persimilis]|uniref:GL21417 n=1 Tax=Drosophila persimilis TaxID=7234 RepID=B4IRP2_DROPE|nr:GL21417 [Drosophila persimilis]